MRVGILTGTAIGAVALVGAGYALDGKRSSEAVKNGALARAADPPSPFRPATPPPAPFNGGRGGDLDRQRTQRLQEALSTIVNGPVLGRLRVGVRVTDVASGRVLFGQRDDALMDPASNQKVL